MTKLVPLTPPNQAIPNLFVVETVDSSKKADTLDKACKSVERKDPLRVFVQVNTSEEGGNQQQKGVFSFPCLHSLFW